MTPGFSERTFEFCFNAEYCRLNAALLASHPFIPSQQIEKDLGYDVEFQIKQGQYTKSVFLQHKVSCFAENRAGRNAHFYSTHNGPYFRFPVDNEQHNTLCTLSKVQGNAFYCAPIFHLRHEMEAHFRMTSIGGSSILLNPLEVGNIVGNDRHNITYDAAGENPTLHSDFRRFEHSFRGGRDRAPELKTRVIDEQYVRNLSDTLLHRLEDNPRRRSVAPETKGISATECAQILLGRVYQVAWLLLR